MDPVFIAAAEEEEEEDAARFPSELEEDEEGIAAVLPEEEEAEGSAGEEEASALSCAGLLGVALDPADEEAKLEVPSGVALSPALDKSCVEADTVESSNCDPSSDDLCLDLPSCITNTVQTL